MSGGALSDGEIDEYLSQYDDPNLQNAWKYAIGILRNYDGWDMSQTAVFPFMKEWVIQRSESTICADTSLANGTMWHGLKNTLEPYRKTRILLFRFL